jgi:hypothetical protein
VLAEDRTPLGGPDAIRKHRLIGLFGAACSLGGNRLGLVMAGLNYVVAALASTDVWLFYTTFVDLFLIMALAIAAFSFARGRILPRGYRPPPTQSP